MADEILCSIEDGIATVTINRPEKRNAMNTAVLEGLKTSFARLEDDRDVRVVVLRAEGRAFCSGLDLRELGQTQSATVDPETGVTRLFRQIEGSRHPTIAMVNGDALAGGCELALHCDLRVASEEARFGMPLARIGLVVPFPLGCKLVEVIGPAFTRQVLFTGQPVAALRAYQMGMVHMVVPPAELEPATYQLARTIAANAPLSLAGMKATILRAVSARDAIPHEDLDELVNRARKSADAQEGIRAMMEKRRPVFRGQ
jgi:enoyl-CoA hydratase/carnithine racemase